jgi:hypothetical protein
MYTNTSRGPNKVGQYYECSNGVSRGGTCAEKKIRAELVEDLLEQMLLDAAGDDLMRTKKVTAATDNSAAGRQIEEAIDNLTATYASAGMSAGRFAKTVADLEPRQGRLVAEQKRSEHDDDDWDESDRTVREHWEAVEDKNAYLRGASIKFTVKHFDDDPDVFPLPKRLPDEGQIRNYFDTEHGVEVALYLGDLHRAALTTAG